MLTFRIDNRLHLCIIKKIHSDVFLNQPHNDSLVVTDFHIISRSQNVLILDKHTIVINGLSAQAPLY